jgi:pyridinium-3,5-biscarboxylic acid mononucleotide synthase
MDENQLTELLSSFQRGETPLESVIEHLKEAPFESVGDYAHVDLHRALRNGFPEVIFGLGKTPVQVSEIFARLMEHSQTVMATRISPETAIFIQSQQTGLNYDERARILYHQAAPVKDPLAGVTVISAGTSDVPVAEEAALTAELMGNQVERIYDVGVSGLHRLLSYLPNLQKAHVLIVVAGMEGALTSVVGGLASAPIIAVPTSVGYGASFQGLAALLSMLNSCANGISVVNIDNGYGAGVIASRINHLTGVHSC